MPIPSTVSVGAPVRASTINSLIGVASVIASGTTNITPSAANTPTSNSISFGVTFSSPPIVQATANTTAPGTIVTGVSVSSVTTTGCLVWLTRTTVFATPVNWTAFGS